MSNKKKSTASKKKSTSTTKKEMSFKRKVDNFAMKIAHPIGIGTYAADILIRGTATAGLVVGAQMLIENYKK